MRRLIDVAKQMLCGLCHARLGEMTETDAVRSTYNATCDEVYKSRVRVIRHA